MGLRQSVNSHSFFKDLPYFDDFANVTSPSVYKPAPDDWCLFIADIERSTSAVSEGRYKDVNLIGAACITGAINAVKAHFADIEIAYVFGGDGATVAAPLAVKDLIREAWLRLSALAQNAFGLTLRIGCVPVTALRVAGVELTVAKQRLSPSNYLAAFSGGGAAFAERLVKQSAIDNPYRFVSNDTEDPPDLSGLSCRWEPFKTRHGVMISILVSAREHDGDAGAIYETVLNTIEAIVGYDPQRNCPVAVNNMRLKSPSLGSLSEAIVTKGDQSLLRRRVSLYFEGLVHWVLEKLNAKAGGYDARVYKVEMRANTDYRRFDDVLRLVLDCSLEEADRIEAALDKLFRQGSILYGTHRAEHALMTCLVFNLSQSEHVHFIDGGDGGFAVAAQDLKSRRDAQNPASFEDP